MESRAAARPTGWFGSRAVSCGWAPRVIPAVSRAPPAERTPGDDFLASFSAAGPTYEGFVKPEVVAPGGHMLGIAKADQVIPSQHPDWIDGDYFYMSGTSQATAPGPR